MSPRADVSMTADEVGRFLTETPRNAILSSLDRDGAPHAAAMWFVASAEEVSMWTYAKSQKAVNLRRDPRCALLVEEGLIYSELRGVLVKGRIRLVSVYDDIVSIGRVLFERYAKPSSQRDLDTSMIAEIERQAHKRVGLVLALQDVATWDHRKLASHRASDRDSETIGGPL